MKNLKIISLPVLFVAFSGICIALLLSFYENEVLFEDKYHFIILAVILLTSLALAIVFALVSVDRKKGNVHYDNIRDTLEREISDMQKKLSMTEEQWRRSNHLILSSQEKNHTNENNRIDTLDYLKNFGLKTEDYIVDENMVFFLTPFGAEYYEVYEVCKDICKGANMNLFRGDEKYLSNDIFSQIIRYIVKANIIIANVDSKNPNVFYELGIAHTLGKRIILISNREYKIPFDIQQYRILFYENFETLKEMLPQYIECAIKDDKNSTEIIQSEIRAVKSNKLSEEYEKELKKNPNNLSVLKKSLNLFMQEKNYKEAQKIALRILKLDATNDYALKQLGKIQVLLVETNNNDFQ